MALWPEWLPIREDIVELKTYGAPQFSGVTSLNTNENPYSLPEEVVKDLLKALPEVLLKLNRYPDRDAIELRTALANYVNIQDKTKFALENIWAANGSNEILQALTLAFGERGALGFVPSYSMHSLIAKICGVTWRSGNREADFALDIEMAAKQILELKPSIVFVTSPNNPTGNALSLSELKSLTLAAKKVRALLIVDEAYSEFSSELSATNLISEMENLVVVRTMSKAFALAGARLGYLIANPKVVEALLLVRLPYHLSSPTQLIATIALKNYEVLQKEVELIKKERNRVSTELSKMGFKVIPSDSNFLLFSGFSGSSEEVWKALLEKKVLIRDVGIPNHLRTTIGTPTENNQFLAAIAFHRP